MNHANITRQRIAEDQRINHTAAIFGVRFSLQLEPSIYRIAESIAAEYDGGYWEFYTLSNGGFYMAPAAYEQFQVCCQNGFEGNLSADALGITACLYVYSFLSFSGYEAFAQTCAQQYHWLREYMLDHPEAQAILGAID
ncbi:MAG TPA: antirestriction protein [Nitrosomonas halophila]|nr:antirestriction protein [Nitrosomonas halophila]